MKMGLRIGYAGVLVLAVAACAVPANEPSERASTEPSAESSKSTTEAAANAVSEDRGDDGNVVSGNAKTVAELTLGDEHTLTFTEIEPGDGPPDILVSETHGRESPSALTTLADLRGSEVTAHDVFFALSKPGTVVPPRIAELGRRLADRAQGWGLETVEGFEKLQPVLAGANACSNGSFTSATYGGILPNNSSWLDRHPNDPYSHYLYTYYGPNGLTQVSTPRYAFTLARYDILQYRGKACVESIEGAGLSSHRYYHNGLDQFMTLDPMASFQYRRPGDTGWYVARSITVPANTTRSMEWAWFGYNNQRWDWRMTVSRALPQDYIDYMRSYLD